MGVFRMEYEGVTYYFIDNEYYFKRDGLYGYYDDCERFAYFSKAVFAALDFIDFVPDIIHANDWQCALVPVYQYAVYRRQFMKTVFTIHNIQYQGHYGTDVLGEVIDLPEDMTHLVEYGGDVNLMKGAIECSDIVTTVSPTYARELLDPAIAFGMDPIIRKNEYKLRGYLNGIDSSSTLREHTYAVLLPAPCRQGGLPPGAAGRARPAAPGRCARRCHDHPDGGSQGHRPGGGVHRPDPV